MSMRTTVFVSYAREDDYWLSRAQDHLGVLARQGLVELWSDTQINVGADWMGEIEAALSRAKFALLIVTPSFLSSRFIWDQEMPRIIAHTYNGMKALPVIARPCAWETQLELVQMQATPNDGQALAEKSDAEVDRLLADLVTAISGDLRTNNHSPKIQDRSKIFPESNVIDQAEHRQAKNWRMTYPASERSIRIDLTFLDQNRFNGRATYSDGSVTEVEGSFSQATQNALGRAPQIFEMFERRLLASGSKPPVCNGAYKGVVEENTIEGTWSCAGYSDARFKMVTED